MQHDYNCDEDDDLPPPPKELMTPQMMASPISSRPTTTTPKSSRFFPITEEYHPHHHNAKKKEHDDHSMISYDAATADAEVDHRNLEEEFSRLPELLSPISPNERAIDVPPGFITSTPQQQHRHHHPHHLRHGNNTDGGAAGPSTPTTSTWKREYRASHIITTEKRSPELLRHSASTEGYARYTTPISSVPPPHTGTRMSSQRRLPYTTAIATINPLDSPLTPRLSSFNTSGRLERWGGQRLDLDDSLISYETSNEYVPDTGFERFAKRLQAKLATEQNRLRDAKATIQYWRKRDGNLQSWNETCAHALLLLSEIRIKTYRDLITRINTFHHMNHGPPPISIAARSVYTVYRMDINLSRDYYLKNVPDDPNYVFILVGSTSEKTVASQLIEISDTALIRSRRFHIDEEMVFKNLPLNFRIHFSLYYMRIEQRARTPKAFAKKMAVSLFSKFNPPVQNTHNTSIGSRNESDDITTGFELAATFVFSRSEIGHFTAFFENPVYPLDGSAEINAKVSALPPQLAAEVRGIWTFFAETKIFDQYVEMKDGLIRCFDVPENPNQIGEVKSLIDCSTICNFRIEPGNPLSAEHQYIFNFEVVVFPRGHECSTANNYVVGVETEEDLQKWIESINNVLEIIRGK